MGCSGASLCQCCPLSDTFKHMAFEHSSKTHLGASQTEQPDEREGKVENRSRRERMAYWIDRRSQHIDAKTAQMVSPEMVSESGQHFRRGSYEYENLSLDFVYVTHAAETLLTHRGAIEEAVREADIVVLEASIESSLASHRSPANHIYDNEAVEEVILSDGMEHVAVRYPSYNANDSAWLFFSEIENMVKKYGRQLVTLDPLSDYRMMQTLARVEKISTSLHHAKLKDFDNQVTRSIHQITRLTSVAGVASGFAPSLLDYIHRQKKETENADPVDGHAKTGGDAEVTNEGISRRDMLKAMAAIGATGFVGLAGIGTSALEENEKLEVGPNSAQLTAYGLMDYRNVAIAEGLSCLSQGLSRKVKVAVVYGSFHPDAIREYLEQPKLRSLKFQLYKPFRDVAPPMISAYKYEIPSEALKQDSTKEQANCDVGGWRVIVRTEIPKVK